MCNQCVKSRRHCSGYRSDFDILHRDETQATARRARKQELKKAAKRAAGNGETIIQFEPFQVEKTKAKAKVKREPPRADLIVSPPTTTASSSSSAHTSPRDIITSPAAPPPIPLNQHASHYFAAHFIMLPGQCGQRVGHLEYLVPLLQTETDQNSSFQLAYSACGLAAMSNREKATNGDLVEVAYLQHTRAMRAVSEALQDPTRCKTDATLASVLLLGFFEVFFFWLYPSVCSAARVLTHSFAENHGDQGNGSAGMAHPHRGRHTHCPAERARDAQEQVLYAIIRCRPPEYRMSRTHTHETTHHHPTPSLPPTG